MGIPTKCQLLIICLSVLAYNIWMFLHYNYAGGLNGTSKKDKLFFLKIKKPKLYIDCGFISKQVYL